ncbi:MAG TPA: T9SS type A sorting domain-containing protein, partial [Chitinophagaceae bacterium]|nr:T9SS type A sorting domain-containing protein [Chitinophagaceae bacterium]
YDAYNGYTYYRLGITEKDGSTSYSSVLKINCGKLVNSMQAYPVPAKNLLNVLIQADKNAPTNLVLTDTYGRIIKRVNVNIKEGTNNFSLDITNVANGNYILRADGTINLNSQKIIIIK